MTIVPNIVATCVSPEGVARVAKRALCGVRSLYALAIGCSAGGGYNGVGGLTAVKMVKYTAKG